MTPARVRPLVLVTGFGPFPGAPDNPSQSLVEGLRNSLGGDRDYDLHAAVLPTRYDAAREAALRLNTGLKPDIAIHFGFSLKAKGFTLERLAHNRLAMGRLDAGGARPSRAVIRAGGPFACRSTLPLAAIRGALASGGFPVAFSDDPGAYVCNLVFYAAAARRGGPRPAMAGFIHIPLTAEMRVAPAQRARAGRDLVAMSRVDLAEGAQLIIETCVGEWQRSRAVAGAGQENASSPSGQSPATRDAQKNGPLASGKRPKSI